MLVKANGMLMICKLLDKRKEIELKIFYFNITEYVLSVSPGWEIFLHYFQNELVI